jgi:hypothetical protein
LREKFAGRASDKSAKGLWISCIFAISTLLPLAFYHAMAWMMWTPVVLFMCDDLAFPGQCAVRLVRLYAPCILFLGSGKACTWLVVFDKIRLSMGASMAFCLTSWIVSQGPVHRLLLGAGF